MKTNKIIVLIIAFMLAFCVVASASPDVVWSGDGGNVGDIIVITNPPTDKSATFDKSYIISGYGREGATVTIYEYSGDVYTRTPYTWQIGASGLFFKRIELNKGENILLCRAENGNGAYQIAKLEITYLGTGFSDMLRGISVDINNLF